MNAHEDLPAVACSYLEELACRAVSAATPLDLPVDPALYEKRKAECLPNPRPMRDLLEANPLLRTLIMESAQLSEIDLDLLAEHAMQHDYSERAEGAGHAYRCCKEARDLAPMVRLLKENTPLQQRLAFALDYVPSRWLLAIELRAVAMRRRTLGVGAAGLDETHEGLPFAKGQDAYAWARENKLTGICLSGGGIRSATFNLGVLQGLAALEVLQECDYLSSVSGGGYIHEWLAAWIKREDVRSLHDAPGMSPQGFRRVADALKPVPVDAGHPFTPEPIRWLRRYSNYLTPQKGLFTADTWVAVAIWIRNTFLNQIVLVSFLFWVMLLPQLLLRLRPQAVQHGTVLLLWPVAAGLLFLWATAVIWRGLRHELRRVRRADREHLEDPPVEHAWLGETKAVMLVVVPLLVATFLTTHALALGVDRNWFVLGLFALMAIKLAGMAIAGGVVEAYCANHAFSKFLPRWMFARRRQSLTGRRRKAVSGALRFWRGMRDLSPYRRKGHPLSVSAKWVRAGGRILLEPILGLTGLGSLLAALGAVGIFWLVAALLRFPQFATPGLVVHLPVFLRSADKLANIWKGQLTLGPPFLVLSPFFGIVLMAGLVGRNFPDWLREWIARIRAWCLLLSLVWIAFLGIALFGPTLVTWLGPDGHVYKKTIASIKWTAVIAWVATTVGSVLAGKSKKLSGTADDSSVALKVVGLAGPYVFLVGLLILLSSAAQIAAVQYFDDGGGWFRLGPLALLIGPLVLFGIFGWRVDVNEFSMNPFYRNRLTRCYLGATNVKRDPNPLTGLDDRDTRGLQVYRFQPSEGYSGPLPIINTTVNLSFGEDLAYQERKAASFFFSPLFSGYTVGWTSAKVGKPGLSFNGFVPTKQYYAPDGGINIATAAAISGAAASPNMGYHTNPALAFLMTLFNVRLGWWVANPRRSALAGQAPGAQKAKAEWPSPKFAPAHLGGELLGLTTDSSEYVYLSDGGHFDNMGLYELVRRRCHRIVICDAESDENYTFEGLGMAIRKCRIDFGVEILLKDMSRLRRQIRTGNCKAHFAIGTIRYPESPAAPADGKKITYSVGSVLYIKSSISGDARWQENPKTHPNDYVALDAESVDILNYRLQHDHFPNDTTGNQWFTESMFESYRRLGQHVVEEIHCCSGWHDFREEKKQSGLQATDATPKAPLQPSAGSNGATPHTPGLVGEAQVQTGGDDTREFEV